MRKHTEETRKRLSEIKKQWLKDNPDKHPWKRNSKFKSEPCERLKIMLKNRNILFVEEYSPNVQDRHFAIDIAFPDKLIALEINGNQHYNKDGTLKPYYQERTNLLEDSGWIVYNIHYSCCFKQDIMIPIIDIILNSNKKQEFDYFNYVPIDNKKYCSLCNKSIYKQSKSNICKKCSYQSKPPKIIKIPIIKQYQDIQSVHCSYCNTLTENKKFCCGLCASQFSRKVKHPSKEELEILIYEKPILKIAQDYNVSDTAVIKWCKKFNLKRPGRGYWEKIYHNKIL